MPKGPDRSPERGTDTPPTALAWPAAVSTPPENASDGRMKRDPSACATVDVRLVREVPGGPGGRWTGGLAVKDCHRAAYPIYFAQCSPRLFRLLVGGDANANAGVDAQVVGVWVGDDAVNRSDTACCRPRRRRERHLISGWPRHPTSNPIVKPGSEGDAGDARRGEGMHVVDWMRRGWKGKRRRSMAWKDIVGNPSSWSGAESRSVPR